MKRKSISNVCKRIGAAALAFVMAAASLPAMYVQADTTAAEESMVEMPTKDSVKFASFNIAATQQPDEETRTAMLKQLEDNDIDIAGLQEIDMNTSRNNYEMLEFFRGETYPDIFFKKNIDFGGGEYGVGTISKVEIKEKTGGFLTTPANLEQRGWQRSLIEVEGEEIAFYNTHLIYGSKGPISVQIQELIAMLEADPAEYKVVVGDFNVDMGKDMLYPFMENYVLANGYNGVWYDTFNEPIDNAENYAIDNIIVSRNIKIKSVHREDNLLSDHDMIWAECELLDEEVTSTQYLDLVLEKARALDADKCYEETYAPVAEALAVIDGYKELPTQEVVNADAAALVEALKGVIQIPSKDTNLAAGKSGISGVTVITDGNYSNYWSGEQYPQHFVIDLEDIYEVEKMVAFPYVGGERYYHYNISVSTDGIAYTQVAEKTDDTPEVSEGTAYEFEDAVSARYVKVEMNFNSNNSAVHMKEFEVFAKDASGVLKNVSLGKTVKASGIQTITDGKTSTYWDGGSYPNYFEIDLGYTYPVNKFVATPYNSGSRYYHYYIEVSEDGQNYTKVAEKTDNSAEVAEGKTFTLEEAVNVRYVKVTMTYNSSNSAVHMREFAVYPYIEETEEPVPEPTPVPSGNLFDADSEDNWLKALSYQGKKTTHANYANMFATHKIYVSAGDTLYWGNMGKEKYVAEMYGANDTYLGQIMFADTTNEATGSTVAGVKGTIVDEYRHGYTFTNESVVYVRLLGNLSTMEEFQAYLNLENGFEDWPEEDSGSDDTEFTNLFNKNDSDIWLKTLSYNGKPLVNEANYANIFTTHKINVAKGNTVYWGGFAQENYVAELYDADGNFLKQIAFTDTTKEATGNTVAGVGGSMKTEYLHAYKVTDENAGYLRILGNISTMDNFYVFLDLPNGFKDWPGKINVYDDMEALVYNDASGTSMPYRLYVPADYDETKTYPVMVFLHGAGERGSDNSAQLVNGIQQLFDTHKEMKDAIVIAPQCPAGKRWVETDWALGTYDSDAIAEEQLAVVMNLLADVCGKYSADTDRIYAMGLSMGGYGTWNLLMNHSDVFAAGIPICGGADTAKADILKEVPIWAFHGTADAVVPYKATVEIVDAIKAAGGTDILFTSYEGAGHNIWNTAAVEAGLIEWLFAQRLSNRNAPDNLFDKNHYDNWKQALTLNGKKVVNTTNYANIFATHPIEAKAGDVISWGKFGMEGYVMEIYDANHNFVRQVKSSAVTAVALGTKVAGVGGKDVDEYRYSYEITDETAAYVRILGNVSTMDTFMVFKNLDANGQSWPLGYQPKKSVLTNKSVLFCGDSITNAVKDTAGLRGWAGRIGEGYDMLWTNAGVSGASASTCRGSNRVIAQLEKNAAKEYDYLILHAGVNDAMDSAPVGAVSDSFDVADFDTATYAGGLEELFYYACKHYEGARIGFIINYATPNSNWGGRTQDMSEYFEEAKKVCDKWGIPYIDLYSGTIEVAGEERSYSYDIIDVLDKTAFYNNDAKEVHIGGVGYDRIAPYLAEWMKTLEVTDTDIVKDDNVAGEGTAYAQTTFGSNAASRLNDDSTAALWIAETNAVPVYCGIAFDEDIYVYGLQLVAETRATLGANVMEYYIEAKQADGSWKVIYTGDTFDEETQSYTTNITLDEVVTTDDIRVTFTFNGGIYPALAELRVYATEEAPHVHAWSDWFVVEEATAEKEGLKKRTCECGEEEEEIIPKYEFAIVTQPADTNAVNGEAAEVTVEAVGKDLTYTWYYKNPGNKKFYASGTQFVSEDGAAYSIPMYAWRDGQEVYCEITDAYGTVLQSNVVTLRMEEPVTGIEIVKQPTDTAADNGKLVVVSVDAKGEGLTYTWYYKNPGNVKFYASGDQFVSADGSQYVITMAAWRDGQQVYCVITDANGDSVQTNTVTLTMEE